TPVNFCVNFGTATFGFGLRNVFTTNVIVIIVNNKTQTQVGIPVVCDILVFTLVGLLTPSIKGNNKPNLVAAEVNAYAISANQLPINPSPALYPVPVAQPPANMIPIPKINEPITVPIIGYVDSGICTNPVEVNINKPILCTDIAINNA